MAKKSAKSLTSSTPSTATATERKTASKKAKVTPSTSKGDSKVPLTLEEAQAAVRAKRPVRAVRRVGAQQVPPSPNEVGKERQRLEKKQDEERALARREYVDTMKLLKARGVRREATAVGGRRRAASSKAPAVFKPLQVMAEGDSWFKYPVPLFGGGIVPRLQKRLGVPILNLAAAGDEVRFMLGVKQRARLVQSLTGGCPAGGSWDVLLFSGGGNDIVDDPMALWVRDWRKGASPQDLIHQPRFDAALAQVRAGYEDLIALRDALSPSTHLVFQEYDFPLPDGRGVCNHGPWLKPTFDLRKYPTQAEAQRVIKAMLEQFASMLKSLTTNQKVSVVGTQGTLSSNAAAWHNELHPDKQGFETFADKFQQHLKKLFPTQIQ